MEVEIYARPLHSRLLAAAAAAAAANCTSSPSRARIAHLRLFAARARDRPEDSSQRLRSPAGRELRLILARPRHDHLAQTRNSSHQLKGRRPARVVSDERAPDEILTVLAREMRPRRVWCNFVSGSRTNPVKGRPKAIESASRASARPPAKCRRVPSGGPLKGTPPPPPSCTIAKWHHSCERAATEREWPGAICQAHLLARSLEANRKRLSRAGRVSLRAVGRLGAIHHRAGNGARDSNGPRNERGSPRATPDALERVPSFSWSFSFACAASHINRRLATLTLDCWIA